MKAIKSLVITSAIVASLVGSALANTTVVVHIVGAPAFRQPVNDAIETVVESFGSTAGLTATTGTSVPATGSRIGAPLNSAKQNQWLIPNFESGVDLEINASFTGSTAGVESVSGGGGTSNGVQLTQPFIADANATPSHIGSTAPVIIAGTALATAIPDANWITASDTFQASTLFNGTQTFYAGSAQSSPFTFNYLPLTPDLNGSPGGVEVYHWVVSSNAPSTFTNITTAQASLLYTLGKLPLSFFTGVASDHTKIVYALSRDPGSGARVIALSEIGIQPPGTNATIKTYVPTISNNGVTDGSNIVGGTITANALAPPGTIPSTNIYEPQGDTGYANFGSKTNGGLPAAAEATSSYVGLLQAITAAPQSANQIFVTYLDNDDATEATVTAGPKISAAGVSGGSARLLTYNGVSASLTAGTDPNVAEGEYTFWSYESFLAPSTQGSTAADFEGQLETAFPSFAALPTSALDVNRSADSGPISHN